MEDSLPILCGVVAFITSTVGETLYCKQGEVKKLPATPARYERRISTERQIFKEYQRRFLASQNTAQSFFNPFPGTRRNAGPRLVVDHTACRYSSLRRPRRSASDSSECYYYVDLDHLYENAETVFDSTQKVWSNASGEVGREVKDKRVIVSEPELLLIVLSPVVSATENPGSMLPFFVHHSDSSESEKNETKMIRFGGFPPRATFAVSPHQWKLFGETLTTQPKIQTLVAPSWGSVMCLSSEFVTHSLYFMEWCVPADFVWMRQKTLSDGWGCDMLGRLLRTVSSSLSVHSGKRTCHRPLKRQRTEEELEENETEAFVDIAPVPFGYAATDEARRHMDLQFVRDTTAAALREPHKRLAVRSVWSQLQMMWETHSSHAFLSECNALTEDPSPAVRLIGPAAQRLLQVWDLRAMTKPSLENNVNTCVQTRKTTNKALSFLENIRERGWKSWRPPSFSFSHEGEELLETSCVAEGLAQDPCDDAVELADVAELVDVLRSSGRIAPEAIQQKLPRGPLASAVQEAFDVFTAKQSCAIPPGSNEVTEFNSVDSREVDGMVQSDFFYPSVNPWSEHIAFLRFHGKNKETLELATHPDMTHEAEAARDGRIADGLEGQLFFIDAVLSAIDMTMASRWAHARTFLK